MQQHLPVLMIITPLVAAPLCLLLRQRVAALALALAVCWSTFAMALWLLEIARNTPGGITYQLGGWAAPWGIEYHVDTLAGLMLVLISGIAAIALSFAPRSTQDEIPAGQHYLFATEYLLCLTGLLGICVTGDLFNLFVFLEISSLSAYALISLGRSRRALTAAFQYLVMGTIGATFILIAIGLMYMITGTLNMADMAERLKRTIELREQTVVVHQTRTILVAFATVGACNPPTDPGRKPLSHRWIVF